MSKPELGWLTKLVFSCSKAPISGDELLKFKLKPLIICPLSIILLEVFNE